MKSESLSEVHSTVRIDKKGWRKVFAFLEPAYLVSVGYMDPGNWATDIAGGSQFGYKLIWVLLMSNLMALLLQSLSARLGIVGGLDLAQASKNAYPKWANIPLYALGSLLILSQVVLSLQLGFAVIPLIHFNSDKKLLKEFAIKTWVKILAWLSAAIIVYLNIQLVVDEIKGWIGVKGENQLIIYTLVIPVALACLVLLAYIFVHPFLSSSAKRKPQLPHGQAVDFTGFDVISYKHIAVAVDFSGHDQQIINSALHQGGKSATYTFIHVVESAAAHYLGENSMDYETQIDKGSLVKYQERLKALGYKVDIKISHGKAASEIIKVITELDIDLLVMGAHGHKGLKDIVFGTTVNSVRYGINIPLINSRMAKIFFSR